MAPGAPPVEVRAGFLGLFPDLQDVGHQRKLKDLEYKRDEAAYAGRCGVGLEVSNLHVTREGMTVGKTLLDDAVDEDIVQGPMVDLLNGMARRIVARSETHVSRYDAWAEQRIFGKE